ncbi:MAG: uracil-DNA glycosylase [Gemmatimonadetes bacterium]|nr:uracil-DNA glycosylase [Gemmatimonadota bacterium]
MSREEPLAALEAEITACRRCPRLVEWREEVARTKRAAYAEEEYWGRPVPSFGDPDAWLLIVGLAPGAHGANRTGRMFTGDESGRWLYRALHRSGFANQPQCERRDDGLTLTGCFITAVARCAPPANRLKPVERDNCRPYLEAEIKALQNVRAIVTLGQYAYDHVLRIYRDQGGLVPVPKPQFAHGTEVHLGVDEPVVLASYHPSQQNTFTGKLTEPMLDAIFERAREITDV